MKSTMKATLKASNKAAGKAAKAAKAAKIEFIDVQAAEHKMKAAIHKAAANVQTGVKKTETVAVSAVERIEGTLATVKASLDSVKAVGNDVIEIVDNAGRTAIGGVVAMNGSLVSYGREAVNDTIEVGKQTFSAGSLVDVVELHTAFAERRINAVFHTAGALNNLAQANVMAMFNPLADMLRTAGEQSSAGLMKFGR